MEAMRQTEREHPPPRCRRRRRRYMLDGGRCTCLGAQGPRIGADQK